MPQASEGSGERASARGERGWDRRPGGLLAKAMDLQDLGDPVAFTALTDGTPVYDRDGRRVGVVEHVMDEGGIFAGVIVHTHPLPGRHRYADPHQIAQVRERGIVLSVTGQELHDPEQELRRRRSGLAESSLEARLRRAWDWLTGRRVA